MESKLKVTGDVVITVNGKKEREIKNLVVNTGLNYIVSRMKDATLDPMSHMAIGTGTTAVQATDTALVTQKATRKTLTSITVNQNQIEYVATFDGATYADAITEAGIFNAATAGTMLNRVVFLPVNIGANDSMTITWTLTFTNV